MVATDRPPHVRGRPPHVRAISQAMWGREWVKMGRTSNVEGGGEKKWGRERERKGDWWCWRSAASEGGGELLCGGFVGENCGMRGMREVWELGFTSLKWGMCGIKGIMGKGRGEFKNLWGEISNDRAWGKFSKIWGVNSKPPKKKFIEHP